MDFGARSGVSYRDQNLEEEVMRITGGEGVNGVFENIGDAELWTGAFNRLAFEGRLVTGGYHGGGIVPLDVRRLHFRRLRVLSTDGKRDDPQQEFGEAMSLALAGKIRAPIGARLPLARAAEGHQLVADRAVPGKVVLEP